jgi:outer membrane protein insertion porin family
VQVEEQPTGELSFSAGYSSVDQLVIDLGITQRNFRGRGQNVRARVSLGSIRQTVDFSFTEPRFLGRDLAAGADAYYYKYDLTDYSAYKTETLGAGVRAGFPLSLNSRGSVRYTLRQDTVDIDDALCTSFLISTTLCEQRGTFVTSLVGYSGRLDRRNDYLNPTRGFYAEVSQDLAGIGGDVNYIRTEAEAGWYHGFTKDFILSVTGSAGFVGGWSGDTVRINDRFYKGGQNFRGFEAAGIGPREVSSQRGDALGGKAYAIGSVELGVPTFLPEQYGIKAALFADVGTLGLLDDRDLVYQPGEPDCLNPVIVDPANPNNQIINPGPVGQRKPCVKDDLSLRASVGLSVHWRSPMGPIRFDFSQVLAKEDYDKTETFRFSTSTRF